ncbi:MAG TPA: hypothetical protein VEU31_00940, partial [Candidatus Acidoferrales bacterium]|nr:hypothetical protein [Candidatus Acidoferrales bacterium]
MFRVFLLTISVFLLCDADLPTVMRLAPERSRKVEFPAGEEIPVLPSLMPAAVGQGQTPAPAKKAQTLTPESRLTLIRFVSGEFARAVRALPAGKQGFYVKAGQPLNEELLHRAVATHGAAINAGDSVQLTRLEFRDKDILIDINGGGRGKKRLRDRIHIQMGGIPTTTVTPENQPPGLQPGMGSTIDLDFGRALPDLTPDELKQLLAGLLDFSKQRSAAVQWVETLPPDIKKAIKEKRAIVGMDRE